ncbi:hypothetical protein Tco_0051467 [Tanacetum coccineum]
MEFNQWRSKNFKDECPALTKEEEGVEDEGEVTSVGVTAIAVVTVNLLKEGHGWDTQNFDLIIIIICNLKRFGDEEKSLKWGIGEERPQVSLTRRVLATRPHVGIGSFDVNAATRPQVGLGFKTFLSRILTRCELKIEAKFVIA